MLLSAGLSGRQCVPVWVGLSWPCLAAGGASMNVLSLLVCAARARVCVCVRACVCVCVCGAAPQWEVVRWLSTCGNGVVEGQEECDDGDLQDGDGCSSVCKVEPGWSCTGHPSRCARGGSGGGGGHAPTPAAPPAPHGGGGRSGGGDVAPADGGSGRGGHGRRGGSIAAAVLVPVFVAVLAGALFAYRGAVYEQFPQVR
jgi:cysteine-rich repeat protein